MYSFSMLAIKMNYAAKKIALLIKSSAKYCVDGTAQIGTKFSTETTNL